MTTRVSGAIAGDVARRLDAAHARHVQVHDDDVGRELAHDPNRLGAGRGLADDLTPCSSSRLRRPVRKRSWSSTISTRSDSV